MKCPKCKNTAVKGLDIVRVPKSGVKCIVPNLKKYFCTFCGAKFYKWFG